MEWTGKVQLSMERIFIAHQQLKVFFHFTFMARI